MKKQLHSGMTLGHQWGGCGIALEIRDSLIWVYKPMRRYMM